MSIYISVVSHGHSEVIRSLRCLEELSKFFNVIVKLNHSDVELSNYLQSHNIYVYEDDFGVGFGANNNIVYSFCCNKLNMQPDDYFIVLNPDVYVSPESIQRIVELMNYHYVMLAGGNLYKDFSFNTYDNSIRKFPSLYSLFKSFVGLGNNSVIDKDCIQEPTSVDWIAGSFLAFKSEHYYNLRGFNENYFMYCEDVDICFRSKKMGCSVVYFPDIKMVHYAQHSNRNLLSKHFFWHLSSAFRFIFFRFGLGGVKSSIG